MLHALGPGHGKVVVVSYFLSRDAQIMRGFLMGLQIAMFHVLSAAVMVALADLVLRQAFGSAPAEVAGVRLASYGLIALIGCSMLVQAVRRSRLRRAGIEWLTSAVTMATRIGTGRLAPGRGPVSGRAKVRCRSPSVWCHAPGRC